MATSERPSEAKPELQPATLSLSEAKPELKPAALSVCSTIVAALWGELDAAHTLWCPVLLKAALSDHPELLRDHGHGQGSSSHLQSSLSLSAHTRLTNFETHTAGWGPAHKLWCPVLFRAALSDLPELLRDHGHGQGSSSHLQSSLSLLAHTRLADLQRVQEQMGEKLSF
ncbi:unnamed protein product [Sphagnum troendelagicum]|uniref:Uncharacterized protein n=1 Tax=Sphagnum troendelagicum TaxID=128251 RepID=A0ABP0UEI9_9BRYO